MSDHGEVDELYDVKNAFYLGNYQQCVTEAQKLKLASAEMRVQRDVFMYRGYLALSKYSVVLDEVHDGSPPPLRPLRALAQYLSGAAAADDVLPSLERHLAADPPPAALQMLALVAASIQLREGSREAALRTLSRCRDQADSLECDALRLQVHVAMHRLDLAHKQLRAMQQRDDDATLTQLAHAWLNLAVGGEKLQDAYYIFQELMDKTCATPVLLNGQAACYLCMCKHSDADLVLQAALEKEPDGADTLANLVALGGHVQRSPAVASRYLSQLRAAAHKHHPIMTHLVGKEAEFDRLVAMYSPSVPESA